MWSFCKMPSYSSITSLHRSSQINIHEGRTLYNQPYFSPTTTEYLRNAFSVEISVRRRVHIVQLASHCLSKWIHAAPCSLLPSWLLILAPVTRRASSGIAHLNSSTDGWSSTATWLLLAQRSPSRWMPFNKYLPFEHLEPVLNLAQGSKYFLSTIILALETP